MVGSETVGVGVGRLGMHGAFIIHSTYVYMYAFGRGELSSEARH